MLCAVRQCFQWNAYKTFQTRLCAIFSSMACSSVFIQFDTVLSCPIAPFLYKGYSCCAFSLLHNAGLSSLPKACSAMYLSTSSHTVQLNNNAFVFSLPSSDLAMPCTHFIHRKPKAKQRNTGTCRCAPETLTQAPLARSAPVKRCRGVTSLGVSSLLRLPD